MLTRRSFLALGALALPGSPRAGPAAFSGLHAALAVLWPAGRPPLIVAAYITEFNGPESKRGAMLAEIGRRVSESLARAARTA